MTVLPRPGNCLMEYRRLGGDLVCSHARPFVAANEMQYTCTNALRACRVVLDCA